MEPQSSGVERSSSHSYHTVPSADENSPEALSSLAKRTSELFESEEFFDMEEPSDDADRKAVSLQQPEFAAAKGWISAAVGVGGYVKQAAIALTPQAVANVAGYVWVGGKAALHYAVSDQAEYPKKVAADILHALPVKGSYQEKIAEQQSTLYTITGSTACRDMCKKAAAYITKYLDFHLVNADQITTKKLRLSAFEALLYEGRNGRAHFTTMGQIASQVAGGRMDLVEETVEVNLLKICTNIMKHLQAIQTKNPYIFADILMKALAEVDKELLALKSKGEDVVDEKFESELFSKTVANKLLEIGLPNGSGDLEMPFMGTAMRPLMYYLLQNKIVPGLIGSAYEVAFSDETKDLLFLKGCKKLQAYLASPDEARQAPQVTPAIPYASQNAFSATLHRMTAHFIGSVDPGLVAVISPLAIIKKKINEISPDIVQNLAQIKVADIVNSGAEAASALFKELPEFPKTATQAEKQHAAQKAAAEELKEAIPQEIEKVVDSVEVYIEAKIKIPRKGFLKHITLLRNAIRSCFVRLFMAMGGQAKIKAASGLAHTILRGKHHSTHTSISGSVNPITQMRKVHGNGRK